MWMQNGPGGFGFIGMLVLGAIAVVPFWRLCTRVGFSGPLSLLVLVPLANLVFVYFLAFAEWPADRRGRSAD